MTEVELAIAAGLMEGEGTVRINKPTRRNRGHLIVAITNTNRDILDWMQARWPASYRPAGGLRPARERPGLVRAGPKGHPGGHPAARRRLRAVLARRRSGRGSRPHPGWLPAQPVDERLPFLELAGQPGQHLIGSTHEGDLPLS